MNQICSYFDQRVKRGEPWSASQRQKADAVCIEHSDDRALHVFGEWPSVALVATAVSMCVELEALGVVGVHGHRRGVDNAATLYY